jgi:hypothetical protein
MTIKEFLGVIADGGWHLENGGVLSSDDNHDCPLWYAYRHIDPDENGDAEDYIEAGVRIGLRQETAIAVAQAADNRGNPKLRKRLLKAAGVTELVA